MVEKFVPKELNITENAVLKVKKLIAEENKKQEENTKESETSSR